MLQRLDYNFNCMQQQDQEKIKSLQNKVKLLEREINERVRSFLLFANKNAKTQLRNTTSEHSTQTDVVSEREIKEEGCQTEQGNAFPFYERNLLKESGISIFSQDLESPNVEIDKTQESPSKAKLVSLFETVKEDPIQQQAARQKPAIFVNLLQGQQTNKMTQWQHHEQQTEESKDLTSSESYNNERRKMRREIKRLRERLQYQIEVSTQAKEGLLISEEENYAFRVRIAQLTKQLNQSNKQVAMKQLIQKLEEMTDLRNRLEEENHSLKTRLREIENQIKEQSAIQEKETIKINQGEDRLQFMQILKDRLHSISQLLPVTAESPELNMFRPQNQNEILQIIAKILLYFEQAEKERDQALQARVNEKKLFIGLLQQMSSVMDWESKLKVIKTMKGQPQLITYANAFQK